MSEQLTENTDQADSANTQPAPAPKASSVPRLTAAQRRLQRAALQLFAEKGVTRINVSDLAQASGMARGTIYNNLPDLDSLFSDVASQLSGEMSARIAESSRHIEDAAHRLANGIRYWPKRAHEDPHWGRFMCRFALSTASLQECWAGQPVKDLREGLEGGRYLFQPPQLSSAVSLITGAVLGACWLVLEGRKTWREAGSDGALFILTALGVPREEAQALAEVELPPLIDGAA
jgi:AcrR family transcriptional regulator